MELQREVGCLFKCCKTEFPLFHAKFCFELLSCVQCLQNELLKSGDRLRRVSWPSDQCWIWSRSREEAGGPARFTFSLAAKCEVFLLFQGDQALRHLPMLSYLGWVAVTVLNNKMKHAKLKYWLLSHGPSFEIPTPFYQWLPVSPLLEFKLMPNVCQMSNHLFKSCKKSLIIFQKEQMFITVKLSSILMRSAGSVFTAVCY